MVNGHDWHGNDIDHINDDKNTSYTHANNLMQPAECLERLSKGLTRAFGEAHAHTHTPTNKHTRTHTHTHTDIFVPPEYHPLSYLQIFFESTFALGLVVWLSTYFDV